MDEKKIGKYRRRPVKGWIVILVDIAIIAVFFYLVQSYQKRLPSKFQIVNNIGYNLVIGFRNIENKYVFQLTIINKGSKDILINLEFPYIECFIAGIENKDTKKIKILTGKKIILKPGENKIFTRLIQKDELNLDPGEYKITALITNKDRIQVSTVFKVK